MTSGIRLFLLGSAFVLFMAFFVPFSCSISFALSTVFFLCFRAPAARFFLTVKTSGLGLQPFRGTNKFSVLTPVFGCANCVQRRSGKKILFDCFSGKITGILSLLISPEKFDLVCSNAKRTLRCVLVFEANRSRFDETKTNRKSEVILASGVIDEGAWWRAEVKVKTGPPLAEIFTVSVLLVHTWPFFTFFGVFSCF